MRKRASLARALRSTRAAVSRRATAGLDPLSASGIDELVRSLRETLGLTIMMVTHDLDLLWQAADRVAVLGKGHIVGVGTMSELAQSDDPLVRQYFHGPRGRAAWQQAWKPSKLRGGRVFVLVLTTAMIAGCCGCPAASTTGRPTMSTEPT